ncbi:MAG: carboxypeptidase-like regulatory domain-containing protein [Balneolaceae bacterium]|nr:carboxypeptidase-like regulatory domain-containing protein [Balneolaceae bacterium]
MKLRLKTFLPIFASFLILFSYGCGLGGDDESETIIAGQVIEQSNGSPVEDAIVSITSPTKFAREVVTDSAGNFTFTIEIDSTINVTMEASKSGFITNTKQPFKVASGNDVNDVQFQLQREGSGGGGNDGDQVGGEPEGAAAIVLTGASNQAINIQETGDNVSAAFTFQVQDSAGRPLNLEKAVDVDFNILSGPGGGETVIPATATTNAEGNVTTSIFSGNAAGPVKLQAIVNRPDVGLTIRSNPVLLAIHGGFPDAKSF